MSQKPTIYRLTTLPVYGAQLSFIHRESGESYFVTVQQLRMEPERVQVFGEPFGFKNLSIAEFDERYQLVSGISLRQTIDEAQARHMAQKGGKS